MATIQVRWRDNNGNKAQSQLYVAPDTDIATAGAWALAVAGVMEQLSDAYPYEVRVTRVLQSPGGRPAPEASSDVFRRLCLFFRNGQQDTFLRIPSPPASLPYDLSGPYAGRRITAASFATSPALTALLPILGVATGPYGLPLYGEYIVGAVTKGEE